MQLPRKTVEVLGGWLVWNISKSLGLLLVCLGVMYLCLQIGTAVRTVTEPIPCICVEQPMKPGEKEHI